nr:methyltransferase domain-containing protein [Candidatus Njordarchaeum guaymaensis]
MPRLKNLTRGESDMNIITKYRLAKGVRKGLKLLAIQTAIEEGYQKILSKPLTLDQLCAEADYDPSMKDKVELLLKALISYDRVKHDNNSNEDARYWWSRHSGHAKEAKDVRKKMDEMLAHKFYGELLRGQHLELAKSWRRVIRGKTEDDISRAREMIAISIGLRAELFQEGRKRSIRFVGIKPGMNIIDLGCGAGTSTIQLAEAVGPQGYVVGVEVDENLYSEAVVRYQELPASYRRAIAEIEFVMGDAREKPLSKIGKDFDVATTFLFWHYIKEDDYIKVMMNISEVLEQKGGVGGMEPLHLRDDDVIMGEWAGTAVPEFTNYPFVEKFKNAFRECGFEKFKYSKLLLTFHASKQ